MIVASHMLPPYLASPYGIPTSVNFTLNPCKQMIPNVGWVDLRTCHTTQQ